MKQTEFRQLVKECIKEVMGEMDGQEPYDPETDQFGYAPRDRTEPTGGDGLGIPEFPQAVVRGFLRHGVRKFFVYSDSSPEGLILGYGENKENAIHNAKTTAGYIKHGGVGHTGELKEEDEEIEDPDQAKNDSDKSYYMSQEKPVYDGQEEIELIKQIGEVSSVWMQTKKPEIYVLSLEVIHKISKKLLKMHGAK